MDISSLLKEFNEALGQEIEYIKNTGGDAKFILRNGQLVDNYGGKFIYEFITDTPIELNDDTPINIRHGGESISGNIITINGLKVLLGLNEDIGSQIPEITITANAYFLLELLQERINDIRSHKLPFNADIAMKTFGFQNSIIGEDYNFLTSFNDLKLPISEEQKDALAKSLGSEITFIWGPPGTGKTTTLSYLAHELLLRDKSILLVSHTNAAIDNALEQIANILKQKKDERYFNGLILRVGNSSDEEFFDKFPELDVGHWVEEKGKELDKKLIELEGKSKEETKVLDRINNILEIINAEAETEKKIEKFKIDIKKTKTDLTNTADNIQKINKSIVDVKEKIQRAENSNFLTRFLTGLNPQKLEKQLNELYSTLTKEKSQLSNLQWQLETQEKNLQDTERDYVKYKNNLKELLKNKEQNLDIDNFVKEANVQKELLAEINQQIKLIKITIQGLASEIIRDAKLIGTTITKGYLNQDIYSRKFDVVIVDEASMAPLPALFFDTGLAISKVIIIGDFRQLAPIAVSNDELVEKWLRRDIFEVFGITEKINRKEEEAQMAVLKEQRRMPKEIAELVNKVIYANILITREKPPEKAKKEKEVIRSKPFPGEKVILCDTSEFNPWCTKSSVRRSPFNVYNAFVSVYLAEQALLSGVDDIAILTPYKAQNNLIHKLVADKVAVNQDFKKITPASVHRFQGRESELVILDLVEGPMRQIKWLGGGFDSDAMRLINVAITRARAKIIFVAHLKYLKEKLQEGSILKQILEEAERNYLIINTRNFFPFIKIPIQKIESIELDNTIPQFCNQAFFYKAFLKDLSQAEDEVVIVSPFLTLNRVASFEAIFRELHHKGIKTFIITKPFREQKLSQECGKELADNLRKLNIEVIPKPLSHEKLAIIDRKIIWHGSLNILSHKNTSELMMRFVTKENKFSEEVLKLCGINIDKIIEENVIDKRIKKLNKKGIGFCPNGHPLVLRRGPLGLFISCSKFPYCREKMPLTLDIIGKVFGKKYLYCEKCGSSMTIRFNPKRKSHFLGCSKYPNCHFTRPL
ncbi:MAG TPA: AAA domain-containing protein [Candidatus Paceibacterota bacterium]|nr:AAA domain-containing protein [Candidatus Paceibacterota bacterium]